MNESEYQRLRETGWLRPLSPDENAQLQAWLNEHPQDRMEWEAYLSLDGLLDDVANVPISSNFTQRTLQQVDAWNVERERRARLDNTPWQRLFRWMPKAATAILVVGISIGGYRLLQEKQSPEDLAPGVDLVKKMATLPNPDNLRDFNAIQYLSAVPHPVDFELLEALE